MVAWMVACGCMWLHRWLHGWLGVVACGCMWLHVEKDNSGSEF